MVVITVSVCPPSLRGDLTRWLFEISTGVYAGNVSARVRDKLWTRVCENIKNGRATLVYSTNNEQRMDFRVHGTELQPVDFDGLRLMMRPAAPAAERAATQKHFSRAAKLMYAKKKASMSAKASDPAKDYVVLDVETTGLSADRDSIIEICAVRIRDACIADEYHVYISQAEPLSDKIKLLTGIDDAVLQEHGIDRQSAISGLVKFIGRDAIVAHNAKFDLKFITAACIKSGMSEPKNRIIDTLEIARKYVEGVPNYKLSTLAEHFGIPKEHAHSARGDCVMEHRLYCELLKADKSK